MSLLYKKSNRLWAFLIKHRLVHKVWRPLVELTRLRHVRFRKRLALRAGSEKLPQFADADHLRRLRLLSGFDTRDAVTTLGRRKFEP